VEVEVKLYGSIRHYRPPTAAGAPHHPFTMTVPGGATTTTLAELLFIPEGLVSAAAVNGEAVSHGTILKEGDKVSLFPPAAGG
jgi:sulfur carrier protein ThiS